MQGTSLATSQIHRRISEKIEDRWQDWETEQALRQVLMCILGLRNLSRAQQTQLRLGVRYLLSEIARPREVRDSEGILKTCQGIVPLLKEAKGFEILVRNLLQPTSETRSEHDSALHL